MHRSVDVAIRRSTSSSVFHAPTDARTRPRARSSARRPGVPRRDTTASGLARATTRASSSPSEQPRRLARSVAARAFARGRWPRSMFDARPDSARTSSEANAQVASGPTTAAVSNRRAPAWNTSSLISETSPSESTLGHGGEKRPLAIAAHIEKAAAFGAAQPLLTRGGVVVTADLVDVDRDRPRRLGAVDQHRGARRDDRLNVGLQSRDPRHVRAGDQPGSWPHRVGDLGQRTTRTSTPNFFETAASGASRLTCSSSEVRISSRRRRCSPTGPC